LAAYTTGQIRALKSWLKGFHIELAGDQIERICCFLDELVRWNQKMNLTGIRSKAGLVQELLLDSLLPGPYLPETGSFLDVGSGSGFPAIPLKILKPLLITRLVEPKKKKASFLRQVIRLTSLRNVEVFEGRIQDLNPSGQGYDVITSRGLTRLSRLAEWCGPYLKAGGRMVCFQGSGRETMCRESQEILYRKRLSHVISIPYTLPGKRRPRQVWIFEKQDGPVRSG